MKKVIAVVHNAVRDISLPDEEDVLFQVKAVSNALEELGFLPVALPCDLNLNALSEKLAEIAPAAVFNLVESLDGHGRLIHVVPDLLDALNIPYSGCTADSIYITSNKVMAKERMAAWGLPTAEWIKPIKNCPDVDTIENRETETIMHAGSNDNAYEKEKSVVWIIKSLWEHASLGLEQENLVKGTSCEIAKILPERAPALGGSCFAERFISGREFNISLLAGKDYPQNDDDNLPGNCTGESHSGEPWVLPPAEIVFKGFNENQAKIVGYRAKWVEDAEEYRNTSRNFEFIPEDEPLLKRLEKLAIGCWHCFDLKGYARVDFRVDEEGNPFILEINANPCISPDAGFAAAMERAGISYKSGVEHIIACLMPDLRQQ
ncbi:DdlB1 [Desulfamplus magnetovallimortis]|uniref:DdlB1 n=1 Tax=Desulfamplus magnetovallimortis TaxID=1246637 RepID=A0A1W1H6W1_9BACT|nr:D-alanine--D-alanine ligase [Desulfamplus magnetovallimortis]SLM28166.1 DdlB1 [Desulfamplus magnetovallimortis]